MRAFDSPRDQSAPVTCMAMSTVELGTMLHLAVSGCMLEFTFMHRGVPSMLVAATTE